MTSAGNKRECNTTDNGLGRAYCLAFILAQDAARAEQIVTAAIDMLPCNDLSEGSLLAAVANVAWGLRNHEIGCSEHVQLEVPTGIPVELEGLLNLSAKLRYCFSLRALAGMTVLACAHLTSLQPEQVEYFFQLAASMLALTREQRRLVGDRSSPVPQLPFVREEHP